MCKVVLTSKYTSIDGRQILYASMIANEVINALLRSGESRVLSKLDIKKAYLI